MHAPCLLISQRVGPTRCLLDRSVQAAERLGAQTVVVHPPFWQRRYADGFSDQVARSNSAATSLVAVENMFPSVPTVSSATGSLDRTDDDAAADDRCRASRRSPGSYDPLDGNHAHHTLDLRTPRDGGAPTRWTWPARMGDDWCTCTCATATASSPMNTGPGSRHPAHPRGLLMLAGSDFAGHVVLEVTTSGRAPKPERDGLLAESLEFARTHLLR